MDTQLLISENVLNQPKRGISSLESQRETPHLEAAGRLDSSMTGCMMIFMSASGISCISSSRQRITCTINSCT